MMSIRSLADFNRSSLNGDGDWLTPPPSPTKPGKPGRHDERGLGTFNWPPARTSTWPYTGTFSWPRTQGIRGTRILSLALSAGLLFCPVLGFRDQMRGCDSSRSGAELFDQHRRNYGVKEHSCLPGDQAATPTSPLQPVVIRSGEPI